MDHVVASAKTSQFDAQLYIFEDNEAVIKLIIKGKKSHDETRVPDPAELRWIGLFDRIILDPKNPNQIVLTPKNVLADVLIKK